MRTFSRCRCRAGIRHIVTAFLVSLSAMSHLLQLVILASVIPAISGKIDKKKPAYNKKGYADAAHVLFEGLNEKVDPCDNFYDYVCAPGETGFVQNTSWAYKKILAHLDTVKDASSLTERIFKHGYNSCLRNQKNPSKTAAARILDILRQDLGFFPVAKNEGYITSRYVFTLMGQWKAKYGIDGLLTVAKSKNRVQVAQISLQKEVLLPQTASLEPLIALRNKRLNLIGRFLNATGLSEVFSQAEIQKVVDDIIEFETALTMGSDTKNDIKDYPGATATTYNNFSLFATVHPYIDLVSFFSTPRLSTNTSTPVFVSDYLYFSTLNTVLTNMKNSQATVMNYLGLKLLEKFEDDFLAPPPHPFNSTIASLHCAKVMSTYMPMAMNFMYVASRSDRVKANASIAPFVDRLVNAFTETVVKLDWVDEESRQEIIQKKNKLKLDSGWPAWYDFDNKTIILDALHMYFQGVLNVSHDDFFDVYLVLMEASAITEIEIGGMPRKATDIPSELNAHYVQPDNTISIPLGIMLWPQFDVNFPQAVNYGGLGHIVGHELVHGYDNTGIRFADGKCKTSPCRILSENSSEAFDNMAQCVIKQYNANCCPYDNIHCADGIRTQGENIADIGGLIAAYKAYRRLIDVERKGKEEPRLPHLQKFSMNQIFWIASARKWCSTNSNKEIEKVIAMSTHSPEKCRVNQVLQNIPQFAKDFKCKIGSRMYPAEKDRCKVWSN